MRWSTLVAVMLAGGCGDGATAVTAPPAAVPAEIAAGVSLEVWIRGLSQPVGLTTPPGETGGRVFVVEKTGRLRIVRAGVADATPFLDLSSSVSTGSEQGLLGLAFHQGYAQNGRFVVNYTDRDGDTHVVEYRVSASSADRADPATARELLLLPQPFSNHNGGHVAFGPDGKLYVGTGDGGSAFDPMGNGQDPTARLGKMLRIDTDAATPTVDIVASGLRNPWRYSFDAPTGRLYIGDVGQNRFEEVDVVSLADLPGTNFGWAVMEATHCLEDGCDSTGMTGPVLEYDHDTGCSITGGHVYRGKALPALDGLYFYGDYCTAILRSFRGGGGPGDHWDWKPVLDPDGRITQLSSFGVDSDGELYIVSQSGTIYKISAR